MGVRAMQASWPAAFRAPYLQLQLMAERESDLRAAVIFSGAGYSWDRSPELRTRRLAAVARTAAPIFFIHAGNEYSLSHGVSIWEPDVFAFLNEHMRK